MNTSTSKIVNKFKKILLRINLVGALAIIIMAAMLIVIAGYYLYWNDSNRKYDLARGGATSENKALEIDDSAIDRSSPVDSVTTKQKIEYIKKEINALKNIGDFNPEDLSDQNLQLLELSSPSF